MIIYTERRQMKKRRESRNSDPALEELDAIKRLLVLFLIKAGTSQEEIAKALLVDQSAVSRLFPSRKVTPFRLR